MNKVKRIIPILLPVLITTGLMVGGVYVAYRNTKRHAQIIFGATYMTMDNPYFQALNDSISAAVEAHGDILITRDSDEDQDRQTEEIRKMIKDGVSAIFVNAVDWDSIRPALVDCQKANVAVIAVDTNVKDSSLCVSVIESDQYEAGSLVAEDMKQRLPDGARIITLQQQNVYSVTQRMNGFLDQIKNDSRYKVIASTDKASSIEAAYSEMKHIITNYSNVDVIFGANDPSAIGALAALQEYREGTVTYPKSVLVYGVDGSPDAKRLIAKKEMTGTVAQYPKRIGQKAVDIAYSYLNGRTISKHYTVQVTMLDDSDIDLDNMAEWQ